jgi:hypothetical protein
MDKGEHHMTMADIAGLEWARRSGFPELAGDHCITGELAAWSQTISYEFSAPSPENLKECN